MGYSQLKIFSTITECLKSTEISDSSRGSSSLEVSANDGAQAANDPQSNQNNHTSSNPSSLNEDATSSGQEVPSTGTTTSSKTSSSCNLNNTSSSQDNEPGPSTSQLDSNSSSQNPSQYNADSVVGVMNNVKGLGSEKVMEKLQQIHGYIQQTAAAMEALEREGDLNKIGQYNTLVKCLRDLKSSEMKLTSHLDKLRERASKSQGCFEESLLEQFENLYMKSKAKENEYFDILSRSVLTTMEHGTSGSEVIGVVGGELNENGHPTPSMEERLARHENEQQQLSERLRESLVRREELMARYQATRERLNNLKRQRLGLVQEERRLLQSVGGTAENIYENPVPESDSWSIEQLEKSIVDFRGLRDKVDRLLEVYSSKLQALDEGDSEARLEVQRKVDQITIKRSQLENALNQFNTALLTKRRALEEGASMEATGAASVNGLDSEGGSENPIISNERLPSENEIQASVEGIIESEGASGLTPAAAAERQSKQEHLQALKDQLLSMKKLLQVSQESLPQRNEMTNPRELGLQDDIFNSTERLPVLLDDEEEETALIDSTIVGVNGEVIHLSESERRNPQVVSKFKQLSEAKQRLAKMEEIMQKIAEARESGHSLSEVLSPENMAILNEEEEENIVREKSLPRIHENIENIDHTNPLEVSADLGASPDLVLPRRTNRDIEAASNSSMNEINKKPENPTTGRNKWERERELSAMQYHFKKKTPGIPSVNEGYKLGVEKGAIKKQARELLNERGNDPRLMEVATLQEELKEKKNALEALMRRMGKSSSFTLDNISDNISENVSDQNSETFEKPLASWGPAHSQSRYYSDQGQSDEDLIDAIEEEISLTVGPSQEIFPSTRRTEPSTLHNSSNETHRNRFPPKPHSHSEHNRFSVNNLSNSVPKSVRPKLNRAAYENDPASSWENVLGSNPASYQNSIPTVHQNSNPTIHQNSNPTVHQNSNPTVHQNSNPAIHQNPNSKVQNTVASALSQLSQVQETINSLCGDLRAAELSASQQTLPTFNPYSNVLPQVPYVLPQTYMPNYCISPLSNSQGRGDLAGASNHILAGLQQCFSQLYLHSLEIQSLSKHLQIIDQREQSSSPPHPKLQQRSSSCERLNRHPAGRRSNENFSQTCPPRLIPNFQNFQNSRFENRKTIPLERRERLNVQPNENISRSGVNNPLYPNLFNAQQAQGSWQAESIETELPYGDKNLFHPFEASGTDDLQNNDNGDVIIDSAQHFPVDTEEIDVPWSTLSNPQLQQQSSDILNNQVLPGTRANNYWDNFRSYSRQNPLSSTAKFNTGEQFINSGSSTPSRRQSLNSAFRLQPPVMYENKTRHTNISCSNNSINKASDKNSSSSRGQNKIGARARFYSEQKEGYRQMSGNSRLGSTSVLNQRLDNVAFKRNNRREYANEYEPEVFNQEAHQGLSSINSEGGPSNKFGRFHSEGDEAVARNCEGCSAGNVSVRGEKGDSQRADGANTSSETFIQVIREAESLMEKHSQQPQFLLHLFHHAAKITRNTDQQVALELLRELSYHHQNNIRNNRWSSNSSVTQRAQSDAVSLPARAREADNRNFRSSNKNSRSAHGISGSDASESGLSSDEDESKVLYQRVKNRPQTTSNVGIYPPLASSPHISDNNPSSLGMSPLHVLKPLSQNQHSQTESRKDYPKDTLNIVTTTANKDKRKAENKHYGNRIQKKQQQEIENSSRNYMPSDPSFENPSATFNVSSMGLGKANPSQWNPIERSSYPIGDKHNNKRQLKKSPRRNLVNDAEEKSNFSLKNDKNFSSEVLVASAGDDDVQDSVTGFEALVSSALREVLVCFENVDYSLSSTPQVLDTLHMSIMRQVQFHTSSLGFSSNFVSSIDSQLRTTLREFHGERLSSIRQQLAAAVTQILIQEYCSLFLQQDNTEGPAGEVGISNDFYIPKRTEQESKRSVVPHVYKQPSSSSLFSNQSNDIKPLRKNNATWSCNPIMLSEVGQLKGPLANSNVNSQTGEEESKRSNTLNIKGKGAIAKNSVSHHPSHKEEPLFVNHREESLFVNQDASNVLKRESPFAEASSFPESWVVQRGNMNQGDMDNLYSLSEFSTEREERSDLGGDENLSYERNDAEADQEDHARNADFLNVSLLVHDLAEADQSQDPLEADCADSSIENDQYEAAAASSGNQDSKEYPLRFIQRKKVSSEQGLDEVPTRLLNAMDRSSSPPESANGRFYADETNENRIPSHRMGHFSAQNSSAIQSSSSNHPHPHSEQASNHASESSSGIGG